MGSNSMEGERTVQVGKGEEGREVSSKTEEVRVREETVEMEEAEGVGISMAMVIVWNEERMGEKLRGDVSYSRRGRTWNVSGSVPEPRNLLRLCILSIGSGRNGRTGFRGGVESFRSCILLLRQSAWAEGKGSSGRGLRFLCMEIGEKRGRQGEFSMRKGVGVGM